MACNLARSFLLWHQNSNIPFVIATDTEHELPSDLERAIGVLRFKPSSWDSGFSSKLYLDQIAPADETLFVDADCLCVRNVNFVFEKFINHDVGVIGECRSTGEHFGDIADRCNRFSVPWVPVFVGAIYFVRKTMVAERIFAKARQLQDSYDDLGFVRLRGVPNEEPLLGVGMALFSQRPVPDDGTVKADVMCYYDRPQVDITRGRAYLTGGGRMPSDFCTLTCPNVAEPALVHFNASFAEHPPYTSEVLRLRLGREYRLPAILARIASFAVADLPHSITRAVKNTLRPIYRRWFGIRPVKESRRIVGT